jgi:transposase
MMGFLARWARRLSWRETAQAFQTSWEAVYRSVEWFVEWGLDHRQLSGVEAIGVDEIHWGHGMKADNFLTVIYQIDAGCRRLLWIGKRRSEKTLRQGLKKLGPAVVQGLRFACSDMWKPYLNVLAAEAGQALHVLDRFHITQHMNHAVDEVRRSRGNPLESQQQGRSQATQEHALAAVTQGKPSAREGPQETQRADRQQIGDRQSLGVEGSLPALLDVQVTALGGGFSRCLV